MGWDGMGQDMRIDEEGRKERRKEEGKEKKAEEKAGGVKNGKGERGGFSLSRHSSTFIVINQKSNEDLPSNLHARTRRNIVQ